MKILLIIFGFFFIQQTFAQTEDLPIIFIDNCSGKVIQPYYEFDSDKENDNLKILTYNIERGEWLAQETITIDLNEIDTIRTSKILFATENYLHSQKWYFLNCDSICNGEEKEYYSNGKIKLIGEFINGKPERISFYRNDGTIETKEIYFPNSLLTSRIEYYDQSGELEEYEVYKQRKNRTIITTFDKNDNPIKKEEQKNYIE
ncbi:hypothetical protein [uncultured Christiangramia sp.]|uniref:hypothetical protein n=1 Tax=Christiangramia sp. 3-2217-3z TaxID=3417564 RepID=UPI00260B4CE2|nr:hypothetical protein [uncultured Christiangramia sp.]